MRCIGSGRRRGVVLTIGRGLGGKYDVEVQLRAKNRALLVRTSLVN